MKQVIQELKRRGYMVTATPDKGLLVERDTFWGKFGYDTGIGQEFSHIKWGRTVLLIVLVYTALIGIFGVIWWLWQKGRFKQEVLSITAGK